MKSIFLFLGVLILSFSITAQDSTYFNKLVFPQNGVNNIKKIIQFDNNYYTLNGWLDTPYVNNQGIGLIKIDLEGNIINNNLWWDTLSTYVTYAGNSMILSNDDFLFITASYSRGNNGVLAYLMKVDPLTLDTLWTRTYTHPDTAAALLPDASIFNAFTAIRQTYDGGFIISGMYNPGCIQNSDSKGYLLKIDSIGEVEWINKYNTDGFFDIELASDSGFYFPAFLNHQAKMFKTDKTGNINWQLIVNSNSVRGYPMDLEVLDSNTVYVSSKYVYDIAFIKSGITLAKVNTQTHSSIWEKNYIVFNNFETFSLHQTMGLDILPSGDLMMSGTAQMPDPIKNDIAYKGVFLKVNADGDSLWARWHGHGLFIDDCQVNDILLTDDGGFLAVGWQWHNNGGVFYQNAWLIKMDSLGCDTANCHIYDAIEQVHIRLNINMKIYPNPTSDYFRISADAIENLKDLRLIIYDMQGKTIKELNFKSRNIDQMIDVSEFAMGQYSVSLYSGSLLLEVRQLTIVR